MSGTLMPQRLQVMARETSTAVQGALFGDVTGSAMRTFPCCRLVVKASDTLAAFWTYWSTSALLGLVADTSDIATSNLPLGDLLLLCGDHSLTPCRSPYSMLVRLRSSLGNIYSDWWPIHRILRPPTFLSETCCSCVIFTGQHLLGLVADTSDIATSNLPLGDLLLLCGDHSLTPCRSPYSMLVRLRSSLGNIYSDWWPIHRILRPPTFLSETCCSCVIFTGQHLLGLVADTSDIATSNLPLGDLLLLCGDHSLTPCRSPYSMLVRLRSSLGNIYSDWWPIHRILRPPTFLSETCCSCVVITV
ncbi:hypothetical protein J6590_066136 [Homalodisca vitripennis]|nr:hypothetical protein J6590_066136 [Homalodisca vitripennis]